MKTKIVIPEIPLDIQDFPYLRYDTLRDSLNNTKHCACVRTYLLVGVLRQVVLVSPEEVVDALKDLVVCWVPQDSEDVLEGAGSNLSRYDNFLSRCILYIESVSGTLINYNVRIYISWNS